MRRELVLVLVAALLGSVLVAAALVQLDPIRQYIAADGSIVLRGHVDQVLVDYLEHGPRAADLTRYELVGDGRPTGIFHVESSPAAEVQNPIPSMKTGSASTDSASFLREGRRAFGILEDQLRAVLAWILFGWWTGDAAATCGAGNGSCFWIAGTGSFSSTAHWSASSGGASCACTPASTDTVTFDASSGAGTATEDVASFTSKAVTMTGSSVAISGSSNTWNVVGNWTDGGSKFSQGTSTVVFTASATVNEQNLYNLNLNASLTITLSHAQNTQVNNVLTVGNSTTITGTNQVLVITHTPTLETGITMTAIDLVTSGFFSLPAVSISVNSFCVFSGVLTLSGALTAPGPDHDAGFLCNSGPGLQTGISGSALVAGANTVTVGAVSIPAAASYITSTSSGTWTVSGAWTNLSTSASWSFAAPIAFTSTSNVTMTFCGGSCGSGGIEFSTSTVSFDALSGSATFTLGGSIIASNAIIIGDIPGGGHASTNTLDLSTSNFTITAGGLQLGISGIGILNARTSSITIQNSAQDTGLVYIGDPGYILMSHSTWTIISTDPLPWDDESAATGVVGNQSLPSLWNVGTSSVTIQDTNANAQIGFLGKIGPNLFAGYNVFYDLTIQFSTTLGITASLRLAHNLQISNPATLTVSGSVVTGPGCCPFLNPNVAAAGGDVTVSGTLTIGGTNTLSVGGSLSAAASRYIVQAGGTTSFTDLGSATGSWSLNHQVDVLGQDLGMLVAQGQTSVYFKSSFQTEGLQVSQPILFGFESNANSLHWIWNSSAGLVNTNAFLYLESDSGGPAGQLCAGVWYLDEPLGGISATGVAVCGSIAQYFVNDFVDGKNLNFNTRWFFQSSSPGPAVPTITCTAQEILPFFDRLYCSTTLTSFAVSASFRWYVNGWYVVKGPVLDTLVPDVLLNQKATVGLWYDAALPWATKTVPLDDRANPAIWGLVIAGVFLGRMIYRGRRTIGEVERDRKLAAKRRRIARGETHVLGLIEDERERLRRLRREREHRGLSTGRVSRRLKKLERYR